MVKSISKQPENTKQSDSTHNSVENQNVASDEITQGGNEGDSAAPTPSNPASEKIVEHGGPKGLEPTRYGDWEANGRCYDF